MIWNWFLILVLTCENALMSLLNLYHRSQRVPSRSFWSTVLSTISPRPPLHVSIQLRIGSTAITIFRALDLVLCVLLNLYASTKTACPDGLEVNDADGLSTPRDTRVSIRGTLVVWANLVGFEPDPGFFFYLDDLNT